MPTEQTLVSNFTAGVVDRTAAARVDVRRLSLGAKTQTNWLSHVLGHFGLRPGLKYIGLVEPPALPVRISGSASMAVGAGADATSFESDPEFDNVLLLLHGNGTHGSTTFTDSSSYARSVTRLGSGITISTAQSQFGGASIYGDSADRLQVSFGAEFTGRNWCIESFIRRRSSAFNMIGWFYGGANLFARIDGTGGSGTYRLQLILSGALALSSTSAIPADIWTHVRISCEQGSGSNNTVRLFVNGVLNDSLISTDPNLSLPGALTYSIGRWDSAGNNGFYAYIDEYRVTMATRETGDFSVPTSPYPDV